MKEIKIENEEQVLKLFRKKLKREGWTQRWIASVLGYDTTTVNAWFCKRARLKVDACVQICKALGWEVIIRPKTEKFKGSITFEDVINTMTKEQKDVLYALVDKALEEGKKGENENEQR